MSVPAKEASTPPVTDPHYSQRCGECGDRLIHQHRRGWHESSSALGQWVHDTLPSTFGWSDIDGISVRSMPNGVHRFRLFEAKRPSSGMSTSQQRILKALSALIASARDAGVIDAASGAWVLRGEPPFDAVSARTLIPSDDNPPDILTSEQLGRLISGQRDWLPSVQGRLL
jgi:hypothetical protein